MYIYGRYIDIVDIFQNFKNKKKKHIFIKEIKDLCSLKRLIEELKIESMKTNFRVSERACYRFYIMALM